MTAAAAGAISVKCSGSVRKVEVDQPENPLKRSYYRLYCEVVSRTSDQQKFDVFHQLSKRPFTKLDCKESGCNYSTWNELVSNKHVIIDAEWGVSEQYAITVVQLRICKVPADHNVNRIVTYTGNQLSDSNYCTGLYTRPDNGKSVCKTWTYISIYPNRTVTPIIGRSLHPCWSRDHLLKILYPLFRVPLREALLCIHGVVLPQ